jgi:hypothetical protein
VQSALVAHSQRWFCWLHTDTPLAVHSVLAAHSHIPLTSLHVEPKSPVQKSGSLEHPMMHWPFWHRSEVSPQTTTVPASPAPASPAPNRFRVTGSGGQKQPSTGSGRVAQRP